MTLGNQWNTIKENWLIVLVVAVLVIFSFGGNLFGGIGATSALKSAGYGYAVSESAMSPSTARASGISYDSGDFAPDVEQRQIIKTASMSTEVERGTFSSADSKLRAIVDASDSFILNENVNTYDQGWKEYKSGSYQLKVDVTKYDSVLSQLREIGEVKSFNENSQDVTGTYTDLNVELDAEKQRLARFNSMYKKAVSVEDKINLNDRIFDQERRVKYLEEAIDNIDKRVEYSTVHLTINEKRSDYANIALVKFSQLVRDIVNSFNSLLHIIFYVVPYAIAGLIIWIVYRFVKRKK